MFVLAFCILLSVNIKELKHQENFQPLEKMDLRARLLGKKHKTLYVIRIVMSVRPTSLIILVLGPHTHIYKMLR